MIIIKRLRTGTGTKSVVGVVKLLVGRPLLVISSMVCFLTTTTTAVITDAAAIKLTLNKALSSAGAPLCMEGDAFRFHDAAITLSSPPPQQQHHDDNTTAHDADNTAAMIADVPASWNAGSKTFTTSGNEVIRIDTNNNNGGAPTFTMVKSGDRVCVYDMEVKAGGAFMGITTAAGTITEAGVWQFGELDRRITTATSCGAFPLNKNRAYVSYTTTTGGGDEEEGVILGALEGSINQEGRGSGSSRPFANVTSHSLPDPWLYLSTTTTTTSEEGEEEKGALLHLSSHADGQGKIWGCVYEVKVVEGSVLGVTPEEGEDAEKGDSGGRRERRRLLRVGRRRLS